MKTFLILLLSFIYSRSFSQEINLFRDTVYNYSIGIPKQWKYQVLKDTSISVKLMVVREKNTEGDTPRETYNVNVLQAPGLNVESAYTEMLQSVSRRAGYKLISEGDTTIDNKKYKWLIEQHSNIKSKETMAAYIYLGYHNNSAYMVTFATVAPLFDKYKILFKQIGATLRL